MEFSGRHHYRLPASTKRCSTFRDARAVGVGRWLVTLATLACLLWLLPVASAHATGDGPDRSGLQRDTTLLLSYQVAAIGLLYVLPEGVSNWSEEQKDDYSLAEWWDNVQRPQWDDDELWLNYLAHPYWGAAYYVRARERRYGKKSAFWYAVAMSTAYEFGAEALFEQPSIQDLVVTPVAGALLGDYFMSLRESIRSRYQPGEAMLLRHKTLLGLTDPLGAINRQVQSWLGLEQTPSVQLYFRRAHAGARQRSGRPGSVTGHEYGVQIRYGW